MAILGLQKVMLVDEDGDIANQCERVLKRCGATQVTRVKSMRSAGARLGSGEAFDFVIVDVNPKEVGTESVASLLLSGGSSSASNIPVLFIAQVKSRADVQELQMIGCYNFIMKPLNDNIIESKIREIQERSFDSTKEIEIISDIKGAIESKNLQGAENILKPILRKYPTSPKFQTLLAEIVFHRGDIKTATVILQKSLKNDPGFLPALELLAQIQAIVDGQKKAKADAAAAATRARIENEILTDREIAAEIVADKKFEAAENVFKVLLQKSAGMPVHFSIQLDVADLYLQWGKIEKAKAHIAAVQRASPKNLISQAEALLAQITHEEERLENEKSQKGYAYAELAMATDFPIPEGSLQQDFDPTEEERILKYIMFEGKL